MLFRPVSKLRIVQPCFWDSLYFFILSGLYDEYIDAFVLNKINRRASHACHKFECLFNCTIDHDELLKNFYDDALNV